MKKRNFSNKYFLCESRVLTKRQQQVFSVRKRSDHEATVTSVFCAKAE
ncbi:hypothetical protein ACPCXF_03655 [Lysinibacillus agricola]